jgi:hypothetical protein
MALLLTEYIANSGVDLFSAATGDESLIELSVN